jgi:hypothetical protein
MTLGGRKIVKLPHGYIQNGTCLDEVEIRAMSGWEEDILSDDKLPWIARLKQILCNCIERVGNVTDKEKIKEMVTKFSTEDQTALLVMLRAISVKPVYTYVVSCPSCSADIQVDLDLLSLEIKPAQSKGQVIEVNLPSGRKAKVRHMTVEDSEKTSNLRLQGESRLSAALWVRLVELDGKKEPTLDDVKGLLFADRVHLRNLYEQLEGGIESEFPIKCNRCGTTFRDHLDIARLEFFMPKDV